MRSSYQVISHSVDETSFPHNQTMNLLYKTLQTQDELDVGTFKATWTLVNKLYTRTDNLNISNTLYCSITIEN